MVSAVTPSGGRLAGKYDLSMICVAATNPFGYDALAANWKIANDIATEQGRQHGPGAAAPGRADAHRRNACQGVRELSVSASSATLAI